MKKATREWVRKAEDDFAVVEQLHTSGAPLHDAVCFHCQQCAEKYLKGLLVELGLTPPKIHNLHSLLADLLADHPSLISVRRGLLFLQAFAVDARYPGFRTTKRKAAAAFRWAERTRKLARSLLGIRERRRK
jgi:HEPN domain-containing protein